MNKSKRIMVNSAILYIRMIATMIITLYISRVVINALGIERFGLYSVLSSFVILAGFITSILAVSSQRFMSESLAKNSDINPEKMFSACLSVHVILAFLVLLIIELAGLWFFNNKLVQTIVSNDTVNIVFQCSVLIFIINILYSPFLSLLLAFEDMSSYAWLSILDVSLKLLAASAIHFLNGEVLVNYILNLVVVTFISSMLGSFLVFKKYTNFKLKLTSDRKVIYRIFSYVSWNLWGGVAAVMNNQGVNVLLNMFFGVTVNASRAISSQVYSAINQVIYSCQMAFNPQLVKSYVENDLSYMKNLIYRGAKLSAFLTSLTFILIFKNVDYILSLWIGQYNEYAIAFIKLMLIDTFINCLSGSIIMAIQATGRIKLYQSVVGGVLLLNLPISLIFLVTGKEPVYVYFVSIFISLMSLFFRLFFLKSILKLSIVEFLYSVVLRTSIPLIISYYSQQIIFDKLNSDGFLSLVLNVFVGGTVLVFMTFFVSLDGNERKLIKDAVKKYRN